MASIPAGVSGAGSTPCVESLLCTSGSRNYDFQAPAVLFTGERPNIHLGASHRVRPVTEWNVKDLHD